jgi:sRNA-binding protein
MKKIAKLLKADLNGTSDLAAIAAMLQGKGRGKDTILAHITPREAEILKAAGGSGTTNPETGLLEFQEVDSYVGEPYTTVYDPPSYDIGFGSDVYSPPDASPTSVGPSPTNAQIEQQIGYQPTQAAAPSAGLNFPLEVPGQQYSPTIVERPNNLQESLRQQYAPEVARTDVVSRFDQPAEKSFFDKLSTQDMTRLGLAGGLGIMGAQRAKQAAKQSEAAKAEQQALAQPYQAQGKELVRAAQAGELTPASQQRLQATQAAIAQGVEARGGVGAQQAAAQVEALRQQLLQNQYTYGLQIAQVGDNIALGAIRTGLQLDQSLQQATGNFYTNLAMVAGGIPMARA